MTKLYRILFHEPTDRDGAWQFSEGAFDTAQEASVQAEERYPEIAFKIVKICNTVQD